MGNLFYRFRCAMARFMYGRNGVDQLGMATLVLEIVASILSSLIGRGIAAQLLHYLSLAATFLLLFRMFSRNLPKRRAENAKFMAWWGPKKIALTGAKARHADKAHKYVKCSCGSYCRVPRNVGTVELTCPKCGLKHKVKT